ncbi:telomerase protein component 1 [Plakobranchus ocellatus]|uniref:Telomerase protein component 1 n=1 Tax=Plakobranchus ocellatus TaxID=259542 RepID=A0AAV4DVN9_9GAST|nr:telomerase protein component 1 [Plakobranchus ocellatus]
MICLYLRCKIQAKDMASAVDSSESSPEQSQVKIFVTSYTDEFFAERDLIKKEILPCIRTWCESRKLTVVDQFIKWGGRHPDQRNVAELEKLQTSIETCYLSSIMPIFINITSSSLGWVPLWGEYSEEVVEDFQEAFGLLYEDLELLSSAFREDNSNSVFLLRDDNFMKGVKEQEKCSFVQATSASQKSSGENDKIKLKFPHDRVMTYCPKYRGVDKNRPLLMFPDEFKQRVIDFIKQRIAYDYCGEESILTNDPRLAHLEFLQSRGKSVWGRDSFIQQIENYIQREERDIPLVLLGASGSGKTSIMCLAVKTILSKIEQGLLQPFGSDQGHKWRVFYHFVGAVPGSSSLEQMLKRLLREMGMSKKNSSCAKDLDSAAQLCCSMLSNLNTEPLIVFVDGADQFIKEHGARIISWVPRKLAPQVRLVMAMVTETEVNKALQGRETKPMQISVTALDNASKQSLIEDVCKNPKLTSTQLQSLLDKPSSENPLWLTLACQEVRLAGTPHKVSEKIESLPDSLLMLFEQLLQRLESGPGGDLHIGILCLLEASAAGLNEFELRELMADGTLTIPPSPFEEKEETEEAEKDMLKKKDHLSDEVWKATYQILQPFLRPYGDSREGRLDFYHRALSKAVRKRYFTEVVDQEATTGKTEKSRAYFFWHRKLAKYFRDHADVSRMVEEYPYHLSCLDDKFHLAQCLCEWRVFDRLYHEEYSSQLMAYWRKVGPISEMISSYEAALKKFEEAESANEAAVSVRYEKVCRVTIQAGKHQDALELLKTAMKIEEKELGARPHRMVDLYSLMSEIYDEKLKLNDFVSRSQLPDLRKTIHYAKKSIRIRKTLPGPYHKYKLGMSLMRLAFNMKSWDATGGGSELSGPDAVIEGNKYIDRSLKIFLELNDMGHYAEALMTKGVLAPRGSMEQLKLYNQAMELCMQMYGELHILTSRLYINIGIVYEDNKDFKKSYQYFKKWARLSEEIMGPDHPKTLRAKGVLRESRYRRIAMELGEWVEDEDERQETEEEDERSESCEMEHSYDDTVNNILIVSQDESSLDTALGAGDGPSTTSTSTSTGQGPLQPLFNIVPLAPNSYLQSLEARDQLFPLEQRGASGGGGDPRWNRPRDPSSYVRSRLERCNAIRRGMPLPEQGTGGLSQGQLLHDIQQPNQQESQFHPLPSDSNQGTQADPLNRYFLYRFDNLLRGLSTNPHRSAAPPQVRDSNNRSLSPPSVSSSSSFPLYARSQDRFSGLPISSSSSRLPPVVSREEDNSPGAGQAGSSLRNDLVRNISFPHAADVESALREHETFNLLMSRNQSDREGEDRPGLTPNSSGDSIGQVFSNGYLPSDEENRDNEDNTSSDHEGHSDSENFYDDNFEDYDEHYIMSGEGNIVADEFAVSAGNEEEEEPEIVYLDGLRNPLTSADSRDAQFFESILIDNRFALDEEVEASEEAYSIQQNNSGEDNSDTRTDTRT